MVIVVMGPTGAGKTTVGRALAGVLGWRFVDGDDLHPPSNIAKMRRGEALTDADREPWLRAIAAVMAGARDTPMVVACSALTARYREVIAAAASDVRFVYLKADPGTLARRVAARAGHFAGPALVASQLATLEEPHEGALTVDAARPVDQIVAAIRRTLRV